MTGTKLHIACAALALFSSPLLADIPCVTNGACGANWQPFVTPANHLKGDGSTGTTYFDGYSYDGDNSNIAYFIEGAGASTADPNSPNARLPFLGNPDGSALTSFYFQRTSPSVQASLLEASGLWAPYNSLGWYDATNPLNFGWIFQANGAQPLPATVTFTPSASYGLFFVPGSLTYNPARAYYTDSTRNGISQSDQEYAAAHGIPLGPETAQHFSVFNDGHGGSYIGINDRSSQIGDGDYNDFIVHLSPEPMTATPEPGYFLLLGTMLGALPVARKMRKRR